MSNEDRIKALFKATPAQLAAVDAVLSGRASRAQQVPACKIIRRAEAARLLSVTPRTIDNLARTGALRRVRFPGRKLAAGFMASEVDALVSGKTA